MLDETGLLLIKGLIIIIVGLYTFFEISKYTGFFGALIGVLSVVAGMILIDNILTFNNNIEDVKNELNLMFEQGNYTESEKTVEIIKICNAKSNAPERCRDKSLICAGLLFISE